MEISKIKEEIVQSQKWIEKNKEDCKRAKQKIRRYNNEMEELLEKLSEAVECEELYEYYIRCAQLEIKRLLFDLIEKEYYDDIKEVLNLEEEQLD